MKITLSQLRQILKEETKRALNEGKGLNPYYFDPAQGYPNRIIIQAKSLLDGDVKKERLQTVVDDIVNMAEEIQKNIDDNRSELPGLK